MPSSIGPAESLAAGTPPRTHDVEATLVEHYPRLVRLAYLTLPPALGRHRRVLAAHAVVQRALPRGPVPRLSRRAAPVPAQRGSSDARSAAYAWVRTRVLRHSLAYEHRRPRAPRPGLPLVLGLRLFPRAGGSAELALDRALSEVSAPVRAALALRVLEELSADAVRALLAEAGVADPDGALRCAAGLHRPVGRAEGATDPDSSDAVADSPLRASEFDPCTVQTRPTDLLRRRRRARLATLAAAVALAAAAVTLAGSDEEPRREYTGGVPVGAAFTRALDPALLLRTPAAVWSDTSRVDFTAWPVRGERAEDRALLGRALRTWASPGPSVQVTTTPGTSTAPPAEPPQLLYAGELDGDAVVLFHDGRRLVRYAETKGSGTGSGAALDLARTDEADVTTAAAVVVSRSADSARFLLAPWIAESTTRDMLAPNTPARPLAVSASGVTAAVPRPAPGSTCDSWPALQLRSSEAIVEKHAFVVTDLGDLVPVHLTYIPPPGTGAPPRQPREATGGPALVSWARTACSLRSLRGSGVRAVNNWAYAVQPLPEGGGSATWVCSRADTWRGPGRVTVQLQESGAGPLDPGVVVAGAADTASCSRFGQHVLAGAHWKAPSGRWYVLAAGSRAVNRVSVSGAVKATAPGAYVTVRAPQDARVELSAEVPGGAKLRGLGQPGGE
ncbi:hypothetical protein [Streptomyces sp. NPDC050504]|uniref:hypothetical protein n=1 Tax=Streptomyces sp. NPDC050504 TaxID=3365618 RepID=UPI0037AD2CCB